MENFEDELFWSFISSCEGKPINLLTLASKLGDVDSLSKVYDFVHSSHFKVEKFPGMTNDFWLFDHGMSPMMGAVTSDNHKVVEFLCLMGRSKDIFTFESDGVTPFLVCCMRCNRYIFSYILYQDLFPIHVNDLRVRFPSINFWTDGLAGFTPLHIFVKFGELSLIKSLVDFGAGDDIIVCNDGSSYPLMTACKFGHLEIVEFLIELNRELHLMDRSTFVNMVDKYGRNAAFEACDFGSFDIFRLLFQSSCNLRIQDVNRQFLLEFAIGKCHGSDKSKMNNHLEIVKFMVENGALDDFPAELLYSESPLYRHPLSIAVELDLNDVVDVLSSHLKEVDIRKIFPSYLNRFPDSLKVIKLYSLRFFQEIDKQNWLFSILSAFLQEMVYEANYVVLDFFCFNVFDIYPRLLFRNFFLKINFGDSHFSIYFQNEAAVCIRLIEIGCMHDKDGDIRSDQAMSLFECFGLDIALLIQKRIFFLMIVSKMFENIFPDLSDDLSRHILNFAGIVDFVSVDHLKDFVSFYHNIFFVPAKMKRKRSRLIETIHERIDSCFDILQQFVDLERSYSRKISLRLRD